MDNRIFYDWAGAFLCISWCISVQYQGNPKISPCQVVCSNWHHLRLGNSIPLSLWKIMRFLDVPWMSFSWMEILHKFRPGTSTYRAVCVFACLYVALCLRTKCVCACAWMYVHTPQPILIEWDCHTSSIKEAYLHLGRISKRATS